VGWECARANGRAPSREGPRERNVMKFDDSKGYIKVGYLFLRVDDMGIGWGAIEHGGTAAPVGW
jgi:hypothetical protein